MMVGLQGPDSSNPASRHSCVEEEKLFDVHDLIHVLELFSYTS